MQSCTEPGKKIPLNQQHLQIMYREWGVFYTRKQKLDVASDQFDISLAIKSDDSKALYNRSRCSRDIAENVEALRDAVQAADQYPMSQPYNLEVCDALYRLNRFEDTKCNLFTRALRFKGFKLHAFHNRNDIVEEDFKSTLGNSLGKHILENEQYFYKPHEAKLQANITDKRPLFKILKELDQCDVLSVLEKEEELISPRTIAKRRQALDQFMQIYIGRSWVDMLFLKKLRNHPILMLPQCKYSAKQLKDVTSKKYDTAFAFLKMLHARYPLYQYKHQLSKNDVLNNQRREEHLNRVQYQIHRNMLAMLKTSTHLREDKKIQKLSKYVEEVMGDYVVLKTRRVMPWKFEFINEVYNILALAILDYYLTMPEKLSKTSQPYKRLTMILKLPQDRGKEHVVFVFGERETCQDENAYDESMAIMKKFITRMENRLVFSKHSIERSYLYHEISRTHLKTGQYDECLKWAHKGIEEAEKCNSYVWNLLGLILVCRCHATLNKIEKMTEILIDLKHVAECINDDKIKDYVNLLGSNIEEEFEEKKAQDDFKRKSYVPWAANKIASETLL